MKKLLLASIIMVGFSSLASAQTLRQAKETAKKNDPNQPVIANAANQTATAVTPATAVVKTDAQIAKELEVKKAKAVAPAKPVRPASKTKTS